MKSKPSIHNSDRGFTLLELIVASSLGLLIVAMALASTSSMRNLYLHDTTRVRLNEDLRGTMDVIGQNIRIAGEGFGSSFPAIMIVDNGDFDELILRRKILTDVLRVCIPIPSGSAIDVTFADNTLSPLPQGCAVTDNQSKFTAWEAYRESQPGNQTLAYLFDGDSEGEWFYHVMSNQGASALSISSGSGSWSHEYPVNAAAYVMEQWHFRVVDGTLQLTIDNQAEPFNVAFGISEFQIEATLQDGSTQTSLDEDDDWTQLRAISVNMTGEEQYRGKTIERSVLATFFPRNVLSN